jgi:hypothetical protein
MQGRRWDLWLQREWVPRHRGKSEYVENFVRVLKERILSRDINRNGDFEFFVPQGADYQICFTRNDVRRRGRKRMSCKEALCSVGEGQGEAEATKWLVTIQGLNVLLLFRIEVCFGCTARLQYAPNLCRRVCSVPFSSVAIVTALFQSNETLHSLTCLPLGEYITVTRCGAGSCLSFSQKQTPE